MELHGRHLIGAETSQEGADTFTAIDPRDGTARATTFHDATPAEIDRALQLAASAHPTFELTGREARATMLEAIANSIEALGSELIERASAETGLPMPRIEGERGRTCAQLRLFATVVRNGDYLDVRIDHGDRERKPAPKPDVRSMQRALGPVIVFGASNFPLAFSVAGGDTASALAAGCPVVVKSHPSHPETSEMVARAVLDALRVTGMPNGVFSLLHGKGNGVGEGLVRHPLTTAVAFTGSFRGGRALLDLVATRKAPIPMFAEMGSTNPVFVLPARMGRGGIDIANGLAASVTLGVGQFCTNPGLVFVPKGVPTDDFLTTLADAMQEVGEAPMLNGAMRTSFDARLDELAATAGVEVVVRAAATGPCGVRPALLTIDAAAFLASPLLHSEVFGPSTIVVICDDTAQMIDIARELEGQLTATIHATDEDLEDARALAAVLDQKAGRVLFGGFPTGVEVCHAMVHGGPYPATSDSRSTSVGTRAITRFVRPVCYQNFPQDLLPEELRDEAPHGLSQLIDGARIRTE